MSNAVSNIKERKPNLTDQEILGALNKFGVKPDPNGDVTIAADGKVLFKVKNEQAVEAVFALTSEDGLGILSGGFHTIQQAGLAKGQGKSYIDITGGAIDAEIISGLVIEGLATQKYNSKLQEAKNLNRPLGSLKIIEGGVYSESEINVAKYMSNLGKDVVLDLSKTSVTAQELDNVLERVQGAVKNGGKELNINDIVIMPKKE